jgi:DNA repair protein RecO (recombination protein O)
MIATRAILMRRIRLTESSLIVHWLTAEAGRMKTVAKGALGAKSPFAGKLDLFFENDLLIARSARSDLHSLREATVIDPRDGLRRDVGVVRLAAYFVELIEANTETEYPVPELFELLRRGLGYLSEKPPTRRALFHFEAELARHLGLAGAGGRPAHEVLAMETRGLVKTRSGLLGSLD